MYISSTGVLHDLDSTPTDKRNHSTPPVNLTCERKKFLAASKFKSDVSFTVDTCKLLLIEQLNLTIVPLAVVLI